MDRYKRFAPFGLYLAGLALIIAVGAYILQRQFSLVVQISLAVAVIGLAANILLDIEGSRESLTGRQAKYGSNALVLTLAVLGVVIVGNYLVYQNDKRWDLTENKENTLAPESLDTIAQLSENVDMVAFYTTGNPSRLTTEDLLKLFEQASEKKISYEFVDPDSNPGRAVQAGFNREGEIFLYMGDRSEKVDFATEQGITGALIRLISGETIKVYFLSGHGEYDFQASTDRSYSNAVRNLESKNYEVESLNLLTQEAVPDDADIVVVAGPLKPLAESEVNLLRDYVNNGGNLIALLDPTITTDVGEGQDPLVDYLAQDLGITVNNDLVVDLIGQQQLGQPFVAVGAGYGSHPIGTGVGNFATLFREARSLTLSETSSGTAPQEIVTTTDQSWAESDLDALMAGQIQPDEGVDQLGPITLMAAVENFTTGSRVIVVGDSDFASNQDISALGNTDLFMNTMDWVANQEDLIQLTPKSNTQRTLNLPPVPYLTGLIILVAIIILPGSVLAIGIGVAVSRRRRG